MEEGRKGGGEKKEVNEVVVTISSSDYESSSPAVSRGISSPLQIPTLEVENLRPQIQMSSTTSPSLCTTPGKPPKIPSPSEGLTRRKTLRRSSFSKPKSRFAEPAYPSDSDLVAESSQAKNFTSPRRNSPMASPRNNVSDATPKDNSKPVPVTPRTPVIVTEVVDEEDDEEVYRTANLKVEELSGKKKFKWAIIFEWSVFVCLMAVLIASLTVHELEDTLIWGLHLWKWCVLVLVIFSGRLFTEWMIKIVVFLLERNFLLKKKVLYFVYGLKKSVQAFIWIALILLAWCLLINRGVKRSKNTTNILNHVTRGIAGCLLGVGLWMIKTLLIKLLASSFQCTRFFDRIQESIFLQYVVRTLSGPPLMEMAERIGSSNTPSGRLSLRKVNKGAAESKEEVIDVEKLHKMKQEKISAWTMKGLMSVINSSGLSTLSDTLDEDDDDEDKKKDTEITNEWEAKAAAYRIFKNVAKPGSKYIDEEDLLRFMTKEEVDNVIPLFDAENGKIKRSALKNWLVKVYVERKSLAHALNDTKTAIEELNRLASGVVVIVSFIIWLLLMGFLDTKVLLFISSQFLLVAFMFGNTAKTAFEAIIFVFVMHPYDVGDRCVVDGVQLVVEEVNILNTIFLRYDNEKIFYPNSVLSTKPISNFYRSPEMGDSVEFSIDFSTSVENIAALKAKIKTYIESKSQHWRPNHSVVIKEIEDVDKLKLALYVSHTINFQNYADKNNRRSDLVLELKRICEELGIKYHLLPQEVVLSNVGSAASTARWP